MAALHRVWLQKQKRVQRVAAVWVSAEAFDDPTDDDDLEAQTREHQRLAAYCAKHL